jgi:hypothetical protein
MLMSGVLRHARVREGRGGDDSSSADAADTRLSDPSNWDRASSQIVHMLRSSNPDSRLVAIRALTAQLSAQYFGDEIVDLASAAIASLENSLSGHWGDRTEHNEAFLAVCNLSLQLFSGFEPCASTVLHALLPTLPNLSSSYDFRLWALPFLAAFSFTRDSPVPGDVLTQLVTLLKSKKARGVEYTPEMMVEGLRGVNVLLAVMPVDVIVAEFLDSVVEMVDLRLTSKKPGVVLTALDTVLIAFDVVQQHDEGIDEDDGDGEEAKLSWFVGRYRAKLSELARDQKKKTDQKAVKSKCSQIGRVFDGEDYDEQICLNSQNVVFSGARKLHVIKAIRRVSGSRFEQQMVGNLAIHEYLGIELMGKLEVKKFKKRHHADIQHGRVVSKRENERSRDVARKKKEDAAEPESD